MDDFRRCVSNYYFSEPVADEPDNVHATSLRDVLNSPCDLVLQADAGLRMAVRKLFPKGRSRRSTSTTRTRRPESAPRIVGTGSVC